MLNKLLIFLAFVAAFCPEAGIAAGRLNAAPAVVQTADMAPMDVAQDASQFPIKPSEAAMIAKNAYPDAKVLGVKLLPQGVYAVTLKVGGSVQKVMVDATSGQIS